MKNGKVMKDTLLPGVIVFAVDATGLAVIRSLCEVGIRSVAVVQDKKDLVCYSRLPLETVIIGNLEDFESDEKIKKYKKS